jgi:hypothetical protein
MLDRGLGAEIPNAIAYDVRYDQTDDVLFVGTLGRGAWLLKEASAITKNQSPVLTMPTSILSYTEGSATVRISETASISDPDTQNFASGRLRVRVSDNAQSTDRLVIVENGSVSTNASKEILFGSQVIGGFSGGSGTSTLTITFNSSATLTRVRSVLRSIGFRSVSDNPSTSRRTISFQITDGDSGTSNSVTRRVNVARSNDAPELGLGSGIVRYD